MSTKTSTFAFGESVSAPGATGVESQLFSLPGVHHETSTLPGIGPGARRHDPNRYIGAVQAYNVTVRSFSSNLTAFMPSHAAEGLVPVPPLQARLTDLTDTLTSE